jgi:hypothetical protein
MVAGTIIEVGTSVLGISRTITVPACVIPNRHGLGGTARPGDIVLINAPRLNVSALVKLIFDSLKS